MRGLYKGTVASVDDAAGHVLGELRREGIDKNTIVVVAADHGEDLFDGGRWQGHGDHLFGDAQNHILSSSLFRGTRVHLRGVRKRSRAISCVTFFDLAPTPPLRARRCGSPPRSPTGCRSFRR